jgi:hypothetical protein
MTLRTIRTLLVCLLCLPALAGAQKPAKTPDTLIFVNGEQLTGELESATSDGITFKSTMAGEIKVGWANIKELRSDKNFALLPKQARLNRQDAEAVVPQGNVTVADKQITVATSSGPKTIPIANADRILDAAAFDKAVNHPPTLLQGWAGAATGGLSLVRSTQNSTTFNGAINLTRSTPGVDWLPARNRTTVAYTQSYGTTSTPPSTIVETNIFHAQAEQDEYFSPRVYAFGTGTFDHNFSSSLELEQAYGGGVGITLIKNAKRELDFKADIHYEKEVFFDSSTNTTATSSNANLVGSTFTENYTSNLYKGITLTELGSVSPAWNQPSAYSAHINGALTFPVFKGLGFTLGAVDDYINNAPAGSKRNSSQYTSGITYTIKPR